MSSRYDDSILLTLNDRALIWGSLGVGSIPRQPDGSWFYNWAHVVNNDTSPPNRLGCLPEQLNVLCHQQIALGI